MGKCLYKVEGLTVGYNDQNVLEDLDLVINDNEILILVGANGAGKSTLLKAMFGLITAKKGKFSYKDEKIIPDPHMMVELGASFVPQNFRVFPEMTVEENLKIGAYIVDDIKVVNARLGKVYEIFPVLNKKNKVQSSTLSGGERQILALGRALMLDPDLMFLDEPSVGLAPKIVKDVFAKIKQINETFGTSIVIVEHNLKSLLKIADRAVILVNGKIAKDGKPSELLESDMLEKVFFGDLA